MAALHSALKTLGPLDFAEAPVDDLRPFLSDAFSNAQLIVDSVPISAPSDASSINDARSRSSSSASSASEISLSTARSAPPPADVEALQKEWKQVKLAASQNPLGMSVYKASGKDGKGSWFARRSVHEGLGFMKWKKGLEREFPETMKVQGGPGEGNIRGIGGERRVAYKNVAGVGKLEVYLLSAQFPGPTTPRDFVTMVITSDQALSDTTGNAQEIPRHFMVISRPCSHPDTPPRDGYIRGQYESVEFIREIPRKKEPQKSASAVDLPSQINSRNRSGSQLGREAVLRNASKHPPPTNSSSQENLSRSDSELSHQETRSRGKTISFDTSRGSDAKGEDMDVPREEDDSEQNPIEWIMITRSDPGGSVPRFMIERGTPGGIVSDASKFLDWACAKDIEELIVEDEDQKSGEHNGLEHNHDRDLHNYQTNGHLAGIEEATTPTSEAPPPSLPPRPSQQEAPHELQNNGGGLYGMMVGAAGVAGGFIASHTPALVSEHFPSFHTEETNGTGATSRRESISSISSVSSTGSFASALEGREGEENIKEADAASTKTTDSGTASTKAMALRDKEFQKLEEKKRKLDERLAKAREKELSKKSEDTAKEEEAVKKAEERHEREIKKQEEKYKKEVEKLELKKQKEAKKVEERKKKALEKDERMRMQRELEEVRAEVALLRKEKEILRGQVGDLQAENTALAARVGRLGVQGEEVLRDVKAEIGRTGRLRASSLRSTVVRAPSFRGKSSETEKENVVPALPAASAAVMDKS